MSGKKVFLVTIEYFKPSGKFYASASVDREFVVCDPAGTCYMDDVVDWIEGIRRSGNQGPLPGLAGSSWDGYIRVGCEEGFPVLVLPRKDV